jgi:hypothetical protein
MIATAAEHWVYLPEKYKVLCEALNRAAAEALIQPTEAMF